MLCEEIVDCFALSQSVVTFADVVVEIEEEMTALAERFKMVVDAALWLARACVSDGEHNPHRALIGPEGFVEDVLVGCFKEDALFVTPPVTTIAHAAPFAVMLFPWSFQPVSFHCAIPPVLDGPVR